jgi:hypothetical protein
MALTDVAVRSARPRDKAYKLADGGGLYPLITPAGGRLWRFKCRLHAVEKKLALGKYPDASLASARKARDAAREALSEGLDPALEKRRRRIAARMAIGTTFGDVALEYIAKLDREGRAPATVGKLHWTRAWLLPAIGNRPVDQVEPHELLALLKRLEADGYLETAQRTRAFASRVLFRYAVASARAKGNSWRARWRAARGPMLLRAAPSLCDWKTLWRATTPAPFPPSR